MLIIIMITFRDLGLLGRGIMWGMALCLPIKSGWYSFFSSFFSNSISISCFLIVPVLMFWRWSRCSSLSSYFSAFLGSRTRFCWWCFLFLGMLQKIAPCIWRKIHPVFVDLLHVGSGHALYQPVHVHQLALPAFTLVDSHFSVLRKHI